jgi:hypothetical protein
MTTSKPCIALIPLSPAFPARSRMLKSAIAKAFKDKGMHPLKRIESLGYSFIVHAVSTSSMHDGDPAPEIVFLRRVPRRG